MSAEIPPEEQERLARDLAEQLRRLKVEDVLVNTLMTISSIGYQRLGLTEDTAEDRDLDQTRLAIETMQALTPVLGRFVPGELVRDFHASVANLQLAYAQAVSQGGAGPTSGRPEADEARAGAEPAPDTAEEGASADEPKDMAFEEPEDTSAEDAPDRPENPA